jgi:hypothetical protein
MVLTTELVPGPLLAVNARVEDGPLCRVEAQRPGRDTCAAELAHGKKPEVAPVLKSYERMYLSRM